MNSNKKGFTLIELLVVVSMIAIIVGSISASMSAAQERARIQKATAEVKSITQAILAYENLDRNNELPQLRDQDADASSLAFLLGKQGTDSAGDKIPAILMASLSSGGVMRDPWGTPYRIRITRGQGQVKFGSGNWQTGISVPNATRLSEAERR